MAKSKAFYAGVKAFERTKDESGDPSALCDRENDFPEASPDWWDFRDGFAAASEVENIEDHTDTTQMTSAEAAEFFGDREEC